MSGYEVRLEGTWSRKDTTPDDITMLRHLSYSIRRRELMSGELEPIQFSLTARQAGKRPGPVTRKGSFVATVRVDNVSILGPRYERLVHPRAKTILRWFLADHCCTAPQLKFDDDKTFVVRRYF